jgi:hypothetical protein
VNLLTEAAEEANHHPDLTISWNAVTVPPARAVVFVGSASRPAGRARLCRVAHAARTG